VPALAPKLLTRLVPLSSLSSPILLGLARHCRRFRVLTLSQCGERPERCSEPSRFETIPSQPSLATDEAKHYPKTKVSDVRSQAPGEGLRWCRTEDIGAHQVCCLLLQALFMTARALPTTSTITVKMISTEVFIATSQPRAPKPTNRRFSVVQNEPSMNA
jgi:hypothetical protein